MKLLVALRSNKSIRESLKSIYLAGKRFSDISKTERKYFKEKIKKMGFSKLRIQREMPKFNYFNDSNSDGYF